MRETLRWGAVLGALGSAAGFVRSDLPWLAALEVVCAVGLVLGDGARAGGARAVSQLGLILQALILGVIWPSLVTIVALVILPAAFLSIGGVITKRAGARATAYVAASSMLAAWSLAVEAWLLSAVAS